MRARSHRYLTTTDASAQRDDTRAECCVPNCITSKSAVHVGERRSRPIMWFTLTFRGRWGSRLKNPQTEQIEPCPTVAAALDQLEPIDIAFDRSSAVGQAQCCFDRSVVSLYPFGQALQLA